MCTEQLVARMMEIFPLVGSSPRFAAHKTRALLRECGAVDDVAAGFSHEAF